MFKIIVVLIGILISFITVFISIPLTREPVYAADTCTYNITYSDGSPVINNEIEVGRDFILQASTDGGIFERDLFIIGNGVNGDPNGNIRFDMGTSNVINVTSADIYGSTLPAIDGNILDVVIYQSGGNAFVCGGSVTFNYIPQGASSTCTANILIQGDELKVQTSGCQGKVAVLKYQLNADIATIFTKDITSDPWNTVEDITNVLHQTAWLFICPQSDPGCDNLVDTVGLQTGVNPGGTSCPVFSTFNPKNPENQEEIQIQYFPKPGQSATDYEIIVNNEGDISNFPVIEAFGRWVSNIGKYNNGDKIILGPFRISDNFQCDQQELEIRSFVSGENPCSPTQCKTALGYIPTDITGFAKAFLSIAIGLAGGISLILLVFGSIRIITSSGDQQRLAGGRDTIIAAIAGLLFLIFSILILRSIGLIIGVPFS